MDWNKVAAWLGKHRCRVKQQGDDCGHSACKAASDLIGEAQNIANGKLGDEAAIVAYIHRKCCDGSRAGRGCDHQGCHKAEAILQWATQRQAA